jgi:enoyl-CoA hydratase/carnithine racemase
MKLAEFVLNDPQSRNAFSIQQAELLAKELKLGAKKLSYDAVLVTAKGSYFSSGGNLSDYAGMKTPTQGKAVNRKIASILDQLSTLPVPTVAIVQGDCLGGGLELLAAFDYVVSVPEAQFAFWQRKIALSFGWGGRKRLQRRLSESVIDSLAMSARNLSAAEALDLGIIDEIALKTRAREKAIQWLERASALPELPLQELKRSIGKESNETKLFEKLWWNKEHLEVLRKFKK